MPISDRNEETPAAPSKNGGLKRIRCACARELNQSSSGEPLSLPSPHPAHYLRAWLRHGPAGFAPCDMYPGGQSVNIGATEDGSEIFTR